jgi:DNA-binding transcriptional ArsR family regulator
MRAPQPSIQTEARQMAEVLARLFHGLGDSLRVLILDALLSGEKSVSELVELTRSPQGRVSTHLGCLRRCGYVATRREGRKVYYRVVDDRVGALLRLAQELMADHARQLLACGVVGSDVPAALVHTAEGLFGDDGETDERGQRAQRADD